MLTAQAINRLGFRVFVHADEKRTYGWYSDGNKVAYFQQNEYRSGVNIATCNKVPGSSGAHLILEPNNTPVNLQALTKEYLKKGFRSYPEYFTEEDRNMMPNIKYSSLNEFLDHIGRENIIEV